MSAISEAITRNYLEATNKRIESAKENFCAAIESQGFTHEEAKKAMATMLKLKVAKIDSFMGVIRVKHGAYLDVKSIRNAVNY